MEKEKLIKEIRRVFGMFDDISGEKFIEIIELEYKKDAHQLFAMEIQQAILDFDYGMDTYNLWACDPTPEDCIYSFLIKLSKFIGKYILGKSTKSKLYDAIFGFQFAFQFSDCHLNEIYEAICRNENKEVMTETGDDYSLDLLSFINKRIYGNVFGEFPDVSREGTELA